MFISLISSLLILECQAIQDHPWQNSFVDDGLSLLQLKSASYQEDVGLDHRHAITANASRVRGPAGDRERQLCPHEIEDIQQETVNFGCRGLLQGPGTRICNLWGDPHASRTFPMSGNIRRRVWDVMWKPGLFRLAAAADGSWEVQMMNCGQYIGAVAARFGKHVVELVGSQFDVWGGFAYFLNGKRLGADVEWPIQIGDMFIDNSHRKALTHGNAHTGALGSRAAIKGKGACIDDPGGQVYVDLTTQGMGQGVIIEAAEGSFTTIDSDKNSVCNVDLDEFQADAAAGTRFGARWHAWDVEPVKPEDSLFIGSGNMPCEMCKTYQWSGGQSPAFGKKLVEEAEAACGQVGVEKVHDDFGFEGTCKNHNIPVESAQAACVHLKDDPHFYDDCQLDFCASSGNQAAVEEAEQEEHAGDSEPVCAEPDDTCDPASMCCNALRDQATLSFGNVVTNNLCGDGDGARELRFGSVLTQDGKTMDLLVKPVDHICGRATNDRNGHKSDMLATLAVQAGREGTFDFQFVASGTDTPATPKSAVFSFLDLDQGKKGKQQESVEVCGSATAVVTDTTELIQERNGDCLKFTSSTWGNGKDNPNSPDSMSAVQRNRAVAFQVAGSSFRVTLGATGKGANPRKFLFAGHPSIACK